MDKKQVDSRYRGNDGRAGPGPQAGMTNEDSNVPSPGSALPSPTSPARGRGAPRWTIAFLRALERTGSPEAAARDAGIDRTTAYARRKAHADFAEAWAEALRRRKDAGEAEVKERVGFWERLKGKVTPKILGVPASSAANPLSRLSPDQVRGESDLSPRGRGELMASTSLGGKMVRAGPGRWTAAAEKRFFNELVATNNVSRAAEAAGVSSNAVYQRRLKRPDFRAKWAAVADTGRAAIDMHLVETAKNTFDPKALDVGDVQPKVTVAEAIRIVQLHGSKGQAREAETPEPPEEEIEAVRKRVFAKLQRLRKREMPRLLAEGWSHDEKLDHMVPPGWVRAEPRP